MSVTRSSGEVGWGESGQENDFETLLTLQAGDSHGIL